MPQAKCVLVAALMVGAAVHTAPAYGEERAARAGAGSALMEEVVVTARKRQESQQDVPIAVSAFNSAQLDALKVRELGDLTFSMPNVSLDDTGTQRGTANFSIRGLGTNASIISIDPTVGMFVDGVYIGVQNGVLFDIPDLESIEVLRGPQGILFGRNVVGGAVLINTKKPSDTFEAKFSSAAENSDEGGINMYYRGRVSGPLTESLSAALTVYYNDDEGAWTNSFTGNEHGAIEQLMIRPAVVWKPTDNLEITARYEYFERDGDGVSAQSHPDLTGNPGRPVNNNPNDFAFSIDEEGRQESQTHMFSLEANWQVGENGTITNIFGWRDWEAFNAGDIDAQPVWLFHSEGWSGAEQFSNELRYNVLLNNRANVTTGVFYFTNDVFLHEGRRLFGGAVTQDGGGRYDVESLGIFGAVDYDLNAKWTLSAGLRYTTEEKEAQVTSLVLNVNNPCRVDQGTCVADFVSGDSWDAWSPKLGVTYRQSDTLRYYGHWSVGYRSGGYNLRNTSTNTLRDPPGPFDQERVDNYEIGFKTEVGRGRLNGAAFFAIGEDIQRVILTADPTSPSGGAQIIKNAGDTEQMGIELDGLFNLTDNLVLTANVGWLDTEYTDVTFDINGDGVVDQLDKDLEFGRAPEWTYSVGLVHDLQIGSWSMSSRISYSHRDETFFDDDNDGLLPEQDIINAGIDFYSGNGRWTIGVYGKNLTNEVGFGNEVVLPNSLGGGTFAPMTRPLRYGVDVTYNLF